MRRITRFCAGVIVLACAGTGFGQNVDLAELRGRLTSNDFAVREKAQAELSKMPQSQFEMLQTAAEKESDPEVKSRLDARVSEMVIFKLTHPPRLSIDVKNAGPQAVADALNKQMDLPRIQVSSPLGEKTFTLRVEDQPLWEILRQLDQQDSISFQAGPVPKAEIRGSGLFLSHSTGTAKPHALKVMDGFAQEVAVSGKPASGDWKIQISGYVDPRVSTLQAGAIRIEKLTDQAGRDLLPLVTEKSVPAQSFYSDVQMVTWTNTVTLSAAPGATQIGELHGSIPVLLVEKRGSVKLDLKGKLFEPMDILAGRMSVERRANGIVYLSIANAALEALPRPNQGPGRGNSSSKLIDATGRVMVREPSMPQNANAKSLAPGQTMPLGAEGMAEIRWIDKVREFLLPVEYRNVEMPANTPPPINR